MSNPLFIEVQDGSHLNLNAIVRLRRHNKTVLAECPGQTVTIKRFESEEEAERAVTLILNAVRADDHLKHIESRFAKEDDKSGSKKE